MNPARRMSLAPRSGRGGTKVSGSLQTGRAGLFGLAFGLCCLLSAFGPAVAEPPPKLYFKKQVPLHREQGVFKYTVQKGEYVYSILRSFDIPERKLPLVAERLKRLNEHIEDLDRIEPGTTLNLPKSIRSATAGRSPDKPPRPAPEEAPEIGSIEPLPYTVSKGDHLSKILRQKLSLPDRLIFDEYISLFKQLNPDIADINNLEVGQRITLPAPPGKSLAAAERPKPAKAVQNKPARAGQDKPKQEEPPDTTARDRQEPSQEIEASAPDFANKDLVQAMLKKLGFRFAPGKEMLYPFPDQGWLQINLEQMPLANAPWGDSFLFVPEPVRQKIEDRDFRSAGMQVCVVPPSWDPAETFGALEEASQRKILFWGRDRRLILNQGHGVLEILADLLVIKNTGTGKQYYPFDLKSSDPEKPSQLLLAYLAENNIRLYEQAAGTGSRPEFISHSYPSKDSVFVPSLRRDQAWLDLRAHIGDAVDLPKPTGTDFSSLLSTFRDKGLATEKTFRFTLFDQPGCRIALRMPLYSLSLSESTLLIMSQEQANPYLVALLSLRGYDCLALKRGSGPGGLP